MARTNSRAQNKIDPRRPFYAAVGGVDVAVAYARTGLTEAQTRLAKVDFEPKALADDLSQQYVDLAARGRTLVNRIRRQQATQDLKSEAKKTTSRAKTTARATTAQTKKAASTARSSAKATGTSAKQTATATKKAGQAAAAKTGA